MLVNVNVIYYVHVCEQARWTRSAGNSAIENLCIIISTCVLNGAGSISSTYVLNSAGSISSTYVLNSAGSIISTYVMNSAGSISSTFVLKTDGSISSTCILNEHFVTIQGVLS